MRCIRQRASWVPFAGTDSVNGQQIGHTGDRRDGMFLIPGAQLDGAWLNHVHNRWSNQEFRIKLPESDAACTTENDRFATKAANWSNNLKSNCWKLEYLQSNGAGPSGGCSHFVDYGPDPNCSIAPRIGKTSNATSNDISARETNERNLRNIQNAIATQSTPSMGPMIFPYWAGSQ